MKNQKYIDYSYPYMRAKKALDMAHQDMLKKNYDEAIETALHAIAEMRLMVTAMKDEKDALRQQTASV